MQTNLYPQTVKPKKAFNSDVTFCESAHEPTPKEIDFADSLVENLIELTKNTLQNENEKQ
jgi:hypothetical protein